MQQYPVAGCTEKTPFRYLPTVTTHHLHDEGTLVRVRRTDDRVDRLDDTVQRRIRTDGHVRAAEIVIDRTDHAGNVQALVLDALVLRDPIAGQQLVQQAAPLLPEQVGTGQRTVTTDHDQIGDAAGHEIVGGLQPSGPLAEVLTTGGTDYCTTAMDNARHRRPVCLDDVVTTVHHALVAFADEVHLRL